MEGEREEKHQCVVASCAPPHWGPGPQPRHVPWLGIELVTFCFPGQRSILWATPARLKSNLNVMLWRPEVTLSVGLVFFPEGYEVESVPSFFSSFWWFAGNFWHSLACSRRTLISAFSFVWRSPWVLILLVSLEFRPREKEDKQQLYGQLTGGSLPLLQAMPSDTLRAFILFHWYYSFTNIQNLVVWFQPSWKTWGHKWTDGESPSPRSQSRWCHTHWGQLSALPSSPIQMLMSSRNMLTDTPRNV